MASHEGFTDQPIRLRQIALVTNDLKQAKSLITKVFDLPVIFTDPAVGIFGLENFIVAFGGDVIEVLAPLKDGTTAGRLLEKKGEGGYMIIMQTNDADRRRHEIVSQQKGKVIFSHRFSHVYPSWNGVKDEGWCIQYYPKGIKGGLMPELDSHEPTEYNPTPVLTRFSPWYPCGEDYKRYSTIMKQSQHLHLLGCMLRLAEGDRDVQGAAVQWGGIFGIPVARNELRFTNTRMQFVAGETGKPPGLVSITVGVEGECIRNGIIERARISDLPMGDTWLQLVGVRWHLILMDDFRSRI